VKPPPKFRKKTVYFLKVQQAKLDNDNIKKLVRPAKLLLKQSHHSPATSVATWFS
jgi:hypothetical protein